MAKGKKPDFALVVGAPPSESEEESGSEESTDTPAGVVAAMEELISAVKEEDAEGAASAFHAAFLACEKEPHAEAGEED